MAYRFWIIVALLVFLCWLLYRWRTGRDGWPRKVRFPYLTVVVILVLVFVEARWQWHERQANTAIVEVSQGGVARCQRWTEANLFAGAEKGHVMWGADGVPEKKAMVTWETCEDLMDWLESDKAAPTEKQVIAVHILTHEAEHMAGVKSESAAECLAMGNDATVAEKLGASPVQAARLAEQYRQGVYPRMPEEYRRECSTMAAGTSND